MLTEKNSGYARILRKRVFGGVAFFDVRFDECVVQLMMNRDETEEFAEIKELKAGTIIYVEEGNWTKTNTGDDALQVKEWSFCSEPEKPLPDKHHNISSGRYSEKRALDFMVNESAFLLAEMMSEFVYSLRRCLHNREFRELNTGILQSYFEGGFAEPFTTDCNATSEEYALSLTSELKLKRMIIAGFERVFEITQSFRNEGLDSTHSPEFTLFELYAVDYELEDIMSLTQKIVQESVEYCSQSLPELPEETQEVVELVSSEWKQVTFQELYQENVSREEFSLSATIDSYPDMFSEGMPFATWVIKLIEKVMAPTLEKPTYITGLPVGVSPFVKPAEEQNKFTAARRAFLVIKGSSIADLYEDEYKYEEIKKAMEAQSEVTGKPVNENYLEMLSYGIPPTSGVGFGINRFFMTFLDSLDLPDQIRETILFPM